MKDSIQIVGFGIITEKQAMFEIAYFAALMQENYKAGRFTMAMSAMRSMQPFVDALRKKGYSMEQILPEAK
jgi:hypothetical protein